MRPPTRRLSQCTNARGASPSSPPTRWARKGPAAPQSNDWCRSSNSLRYAVASGPAPFATFSRRSPTRLSTRLAGRCHRYPLVRAEAYHTPATSSEDVRRQGGLPPTQRCAKVGHDAGHPCGEPEGHLHRRPPRRCPDIVGPPRRGMDMGALHLRNPHQDPRRPPHPALGASVLVVEVRVPLAQGRRRGARPLPRHDGRNVVGGSSVHKVGQARGCVLHGVSPASSRAGRSVATPESRWYCTGWRFSHRCHAGPCLGTRIAAYRARRRHSPSRLGAWEGVHGTSAPGSAPAGLISSTTESRTRHGTGGSEFFFMESSPPSPGAAAAAAADAGEVPGRLGGSGTRATAMRGAAASSSSDRAAALDS